MSDLFDLEIEPEPPAAAPATIEEAQKAPETGLRLVSTRSEAELMPPDFAVPALAEFVPDVRLRTVAEGLGREALALDVKTPEGRKAADAKLLSLRGAIKAVEACFEDATAEANRRHKRLTGLRNEWLEQPLEAADTVARRLVEEDARLDRIAQEQQRANQAAADEKARRDAAAAAQAAEAAQQPPAVVEKLKQEAKTASAPPVSRPAPPPLASTATKKGWKARLAGTPADADPNPEIKDLTDAQRLPLLQLCKAIADGKAPIAVIKTIDWAYLNKRAENETTALAIPGVEAFEYTAPRAKPGRRS